MCRVVIYLGVGVCGALCMGSLTKHCVCRVRYGNRFAGAKQWVGPFVFLVLFLGGLRVYRATCACGRVLDG